MSTRYKLQVLQWQMHFLRAGGAACAYSPIETRFFDTEAAAREAIPAYQQMYANPPQSYVQLVAIDSSGPFQEQARVLYEQPGPRNGVQNCKVPPGW